MKSHIGKEMNYPNIHHFDDETIQLYSGNQKDMIPFLSIRLYKHSIIFQISGGDSLEVLEDEARKLGQGIMNLIDQLNETNAWYDRLGNALSKIAKKELKK